MKIEKQCKICEFNIDGICAGHGDTYKYGDKITDVTKTCDDWNASLEYFTYLTTNAPRFLREQFNDCRISYNEFLSQLEDYVAGSAIPTNFFDAIKFVYGISMVDIAVLLEVTFGVVYRAKTKGIPQKRIHQFASELCVEPELLTSITTSDFEKLRKSRKDFFAKSNVEQRINAVPEWKQNLANVISSKYLSCPIHIAKDFARVDKLYWTEDMSLDDFTESERVLIKYMSKHNKYQKPVNSLEYSLDLACSPHIHISMHEK
ncbi:MAG: hypothetical protein FWF05_02470 [Oscillospiraceae bacterium]|nr:hypothetical protein [Oscillospiraceae bacterium]